MIYTLALYALCACLLAPSAAALYVAFKSWRACERIHKSTTHDYEKL